LLGTGKLVVVDNLINQATSTLKLKALVPNPGKHLWPNQFVKARALLDTRRAALVIPAAAIQRGPAGTFVFVVGANQSAEVRAIEVASIAGDVAVIGKGLEGGEAVVTEGQSQLRAGATVSTRGFDAKGGKGDGQGKHDAALDEKAAAPKKARP